MGTSCRCGGVLHFRKIKVNFRCTLLPKLKQIENKILRVIRQSLSSKLNTVPDHIVPIQYTVAITSSDALLYN